MFEVELEKIVFYPPSKGYAILLKEIGGNRQLPVIVGAFEAQSIALALEKVKMPRPMTHDLFANVMKELELLIGKVVVTDLVGGTFYGKIYATKSDTKEMLEIDSRPSDAIALALRMGAPIYIEEKVMLKLEKSRSPKSEEAMAGSPEIENLTELLELKNDLQEAVEREDYELAAKLRDKIKKLEKDSNSN
jgi:hypothetical protein